MKGLEIGFFAFSTSRNVLH